MIEKIPLHPQDALVSLCMNLKMHICVFIPQASFTAHKTHSTALFVSGTNVQNLVNLERFFKNFEI